MTLLHYKATTRDELTSETSARFGGYTDAMTYDGVTMNTTTGPGDPTSVRGITFTFDTKGDNQITADRNGRAWGYDGDGDATTYFSNLNAYDPEDRMTAYALPAGGGHARLTMGYNADGMRAWKENSRAPFTCLLSVNQPYACLPSRALGNNPGTRRR